MRLHPLSNLPLGELQLACQGFATLLERRIFCFTYSEVFASLEYNPVGFGSAVCILLWRRTGKSTARVSSRKYFIPGCVGRGLDLDLRIRPAPAPAASGNPSGWAQAGPTWVGPSRAQVGGPRIHRFGPLGIEVEKQGFRTVRLITGQKFP